MKEMLDAGVHFGHQTERWNPKMKNYVYTDRGGIHIIDLQKTVAKAQKAAEFVKSVAASGGRMIFVGTKKQANEAVREAAEKCGQFYVVKRWLGGTLTNFQTIKSSIDRLKRIDQMREKGELNFYSKKERSGIEKEYVKLSEYLNGIREMKDAPAAIFVVDLNKEHIAVQEARRLGIPVVAIADTNTDPEMVEYPIPGNDDAIRSIRLFCDLVARSYQEGAEAYQNKLAEKGPGAEEPVAPTQEREARPARERGARRGPRGQDQQAQPPSAGPAVVKVSRARKLVAAGTAEDVEIAMELDSAPEVTAAESEDENATATVTPPAKG
jgi:small subunit ribosomal protein S2